MKIYYAPGTCALASWISLEWAGADYEAINVNEIEEEYKKINPSGTVPALDSGDGELKTQGFAILSYISQKYKDKDLGPEDSLEGWFKFNQIGLFLAADYHPSFGPLFGPKGFTTSDDEEEINHIKEAAYKNIENNVKKLDSMLEGKDYLYEDKKTVLDAYAYIITSWLEGTPVSWKDYPNLNSFMERLSEDEAVRKVKKNQ